MAVERASEQDVRIEEPPLRCGRCSYPLPMSATRVLADFVVRTTHADLPPDVLHAARRCVVNAAAVGLHAARDPSLAILLSTFKEEGGRPLAAVWGTDTRVSAQQAAL